MTKTLNKLRHWLCRKAFDVITPSIDYSLKSGDMATSRHWHHGPVEIVSVNWALLAAAVRLAPGGGIVVWPIWSLRKVDAP